MWKNLGGELRQLIIVILEKKITGSLPTFYICASCHGLTKLLPWLLSSYIGLFEMRKILQNNVISLVYVQ